MTTHETLLHTTVTGHEVRHQPGPELRAFLARLAAMVADPAATETDMIALGYSRQNPLLAAPPGDLAGDRGFVTKDVLADPSYRVMTDLLTRKRFAEQGVDVEQLAAEYTITVPEAARYLKVSESAVRQAIAAGRLRSWVKGGQHWLHLRNVDAFERALHPEASEPARPTVTPVAPLHVHVGHRAGASMNLRHLGDLEGTAKAGRNETTGTLSAWRRVAVLTTEGTSARLVVLLPVPGGPEQSIEHEGFFVRGPFHIESKINNPKKARAAWAAFEAA